MMQNHYEILGVSPNSETEVITAAYRAMMRKYHPDTNKSASASERAKQINAAYDALKNPITRSEYDKNIKVSKEWKENETKYSNNFLNFEDVKITKNSDFIKNPKVNKKLIALFTAFVLVFIIGYNSKSDFPQKYQSRDEIYRVKRSLASSISKQIKPKWAAPQGADSDKLVTILSWDLNDDGSLIGRPRIVSQQGVTPANEVLAKRHAEQAIRAVQLASPFDLPKRFYSSWKRIAAFRFDMIINHYEILGVSPNAESEVIKAAYHAILQKHNTSNNISTINSDQAKQINYSYNVLKNPLTRRKYDEILKKSYERRELANRSYNPNTGKLDPP